MSVGHFLAPDILIVRKEALRGRGEISPSKAPVSQPSGIEEAS